MLFFAAWGLMEWIFISAFFLLLILGTAFDRRGQESPKWWIFGLGFAAIGWYYWPDFTFFGTPTGKQVVLWDVVRTWTFWAPLAAYLAAGLVYSILEFFLDVRRSARFYAEQWQEFLKSVRRIPVKDAEGNPVMGKPDRFGNAAQETRDQPYTEIYESVRANGDQSEYYETAKDFSKSFVGNFRFKNRIVALVIGEDRIKPEPHVNRLELAEHVSAWTFLWPAYLVSLIIGDLLTEVFNVIADVLANISTRFVKLSFANVFKF